MIVCTLIGFNLRFIYEIQFYWLCSYSSIFNQEHLVHFRPASKLVTEYSNYYLIRQEDLTSTHELYSKYTT